MEWKEERERKGGHMERSRKTEREEDPQLYFCPSEKAT